MSIEFYSKSNQFYELSNFHICPFILDNKEWSTVEHYFQTQKFPTDNILQDKIRLCKSPTIAKRLGRTKTTHFRADWEHVKESVMKDALKAKFIQNKNLNSLLKETKDLILKENSPNDTFWGIGKSKTGKNRLGILLMEIRSEL
jgi:ribA/ribD-fused uncharacterized protein